MSRLFFLILLMANLIVLILYLLGLTPWNHDEREPARLKQQLNSERIRVLTEQEQAAQSAAEKNSSSIKCLQVGTFNKQSTAAFENRLARLELTDLPKKLMVSEEGTFMVFLPPVKKGQTATQKRLDELRKFGFADLHFIQDQSARRGGISLGVFRKLELAQLQLEHAHRIGATDARIENYTMTVTRTAYQLRGLPSKAKPQLESILTEFAGTEISECQP
jgi:cell division protein FtsN